jgi:hypothetical protein
VLGHLVPISDSAHRYADRRLAREPAAPAAGGGRDTGEIALGGGQQRLALAGPLRREQRVAADNQAFARVVRGRDLGQIALIEQRQLQRPGFGQ